jgi:hypothetical protein
LPDFLQKLLNGGKTAEEKEVAVKAKAKATEPKKNMQV